MFQRTRGLIEFTKILTAAALFSWVDGIFALLVDLHTPRLDFARIVVEHIAAVNALSRARVLDANAISYRKGKLIVWMLSIFTNAVL